MIDGKMPKDIRVYKTKIVGPLTGRQMICLALMGVIDLILYKLVITPYELPREFIIYGLIFIDLPIAALGWIEPQGMTLEKYIWNVVVRYLLSPAKRKPKCMIYDPAHGKKTPNNGKLKKKRANAAKKGMKTYK